jgi:hypothetical protein
LDATAVWKMYQTGIEYKSSIGLYDTVAKNERFFAGDQWAGVYAPDLPKPVVNFIKRICQQKIAEISESPMKVIFTPMEYPSFTNKSDESLVPLTDREAELLTGMFEADWERLKMDSINRDGLLDACVSGDYILYNYWDDHLPTGQRAKGRVSVETVDNVNYYPYDPAEKEVQLQQSVIIARRELISEVIAQARRWGRPQSETELIGGDDGGLYQSGDLSRKDVKLAGDGKCITLLFLRRDPSSGRITAQKSTRDAIVRPLWDTKLTRYPIALMNWERRKNCCHGRPEISGLVPAQRYINQMYAMCMLFTMQAACPKPIYNQGMINAWSNAVGTAIPVNGDINAAAKFLTPPSLPSDVYSLTERLMRTTLEMAGVTNVALGNVNPTNTSALITARQISIVPLTTVEQRFHAVVEDFARNWLDMICACQTVPRWVETGSGKQREIAVFDPERLRGKLFSVRCDVGASTAWSEENSVSTLKSMFDSGMIDAAQFVKRLPENYIPMRDALLRELGAADNKEEK